MAMKYSFAELGNNIVTRKFGGTLIGTADPYLTGYHFIRFDYLPPNLANYTTNFNSSISSNSEIETILAASCLSVTPPGGTLNTVEFTGLGGIKWAVPGNIDYGTTVSMKFLEFNKTPILDIMHCWFKMIRDYRLGISEKLKTTDDGGNAKKDYAATLYYWTTSPDAHGIEYYACYDGVFPTKDPQDLFSSDVETVGRVDVEIEFHFDTAWHEKWVLDKCKNLNNNFTGIIQTYKDRKPAGV
jgi:hypothetical protein